MGLYKIIQNLYLKYVQESNKDNKKVLKFIYPINLNIMELTELIKDYVATELLSSIELDFLEGELWETIQHISEINTLTVAPKDICKKLELKENSCWQLCCAAVLDFLRPLKKKNERVENLNKLISQYNLGNK